MVRLLVGRYAAGAGRICRARCGSRLRSSIPRSGCITRAPPTGSCERIDQLPCIRPQRPVGVLLLRSYALSSNAAHYDGVISALEAKGLQVIPAFASGLDQREAVQHYFTRNGAGDRGCRRLADRVQPGRRPSLQRCPRRRGTAGRPGRALHRRPSGRIPDAGAVEGRRPRPAAGGGHHDGGDPGTGRRASGR